MVEELGERKHAFARGIGVSTAAAVCVCAMLWLGVVAFQGGPQTGRDHALPASLALLFFSIGLTQWLWLLPLTVFSFRKGRPKFGWGMVTSGIAITLLNAAFVWNIFRTHSS